MQTPDFSIDTLNSATLAGTAHRRDAVIPVDARAEDFDAQYDWATLWYDAFRNDQGLFLICPKLLNFRALLRQGLLIDGQPAQIKSMRRFRRHDVIRLSDHPSAQALTLQADATSIGSGISPDSTHLFDGLNSSLHISRNNRLSWIADWIHFHVEEHGLEAMVLMDNGSDAYPAEAILDVLANSRLKRGVVLKVPQPYGPVRGKRGGGGAKFLQPSMLNLARMRYLARARAVLNVDIDELVWRTGPSVFDAACSSPLGFVSFTGTWRVPGHDSTEPYSHFDHIHMRPDSADCPPKYCIRPNGPLRWASWDVHRPEAPLPFGWFQRRDLGYWHCRAITTNWKTYNRLNLRKIGPIDPTAESVLKPYSAT